MTTGMRHDRDGAPQPQRFVISFAGFNRPWAVWIAHRLEEHGHRVALQRWDPQTSPGLTEALEDLARSGGRVLVVLSERYFSAGTHTDEEWNAALRTVTGAHPDRFAAVCLTDSPLPSAVAALEKTDLWGLDAYEAEYRVLRRLELPTDRIGTESGRRGPRFPNDPPEVWGRVPRRNPRFTGRNDVIGALRAALTEAPPGASTVTLLGLSGVGKTQVATEYAYRFASEYDVVWWVPAEDRPTLRERLADLAPALDLPRGAGSYGEQIRAVLEALRRGTPYHRWLLVFDGCDHPDDLIDLLPSGAGDVIITSRNREWAARHTSLVEVPLYARPESVTFIRRRARRLSGDEADQLAEALEDYPLALDQTAGWLADSPLGVGEYLTLLRRRLDTHEAVTLSDDYPLPFPTALAILLNNVRENFPDALALLRLFVFFAPGRVPLRLLREFPAADVPEHLAGLINDQIRWNAALNKLVQFSVVRLEYSDLSVEEGGGGLETVQLHRMVHNIVRDDLGEEEAEQLSRAVRQVLAAADPGRPTDSRLWPRYAELIPHLETAGVLTSTNPRIQNFLLHCLRYLILAGEYRTCLRLAEETDGAWRSMLGEDHDQVRELSYHHGGALRMLGHFRRAEVLAKSVADRLVEERGDRDLETLRATSTYAGVLLGTAKFEQARLLLEHAFTTYRELLGEDDSTTLNAQNNVAVALRLLGRYQEAYDIDLDTLRRRERVLRVRHIATLSSGIGCAMGLRLMGRYREAQARQEQGLKLNAQVLGPNHPQTLRAEHNLGMCLRRAGDIPGAGARLRGVLERSTRVFGAEFPWTLMVASDYATYLREYGDVGEARRISEDVVRGYQSQLGLAHPYSIGTVGNLGLVLRAQGEREEALNLAEQALVGMRGALGDRHPWTLGCALNATGHRNITGRLEDAVDLSRATLRAAGQVLGPDHPMTLSAEIALAADLRAVREDVEASKHEDAGLRALMRTLGPQHVHTVSARQQTRPYWDFEPQP
ncbi:FxSxx-COOH system tetratricopeptide repeat protein [Streptomyces sp. NPDC054949]|uniref:FxSxx-COOH system tetratricopeptide repeat protein n=1 Tax=unclassified Streptomyces TaxID=2593676 RepID=UPI0006B03E9F|nr:MULTISPECIES: FxSxx-COOH system tetratricopeptide repeat protein [unclassified Streptomyces]KOU66059.1 ATP-binding protein [Streptomyces sp. WM4235]MCX5073406.1 FxSxx-COOH system tetratricopeptide repeat protein [Streptomyces sp. NBC_00424]WUD43333.1 FxSxx-COOH system tetratricopeptide repeat protein [Streptomyces sp. NBC_00513]